MKRVENLIGKTFGKLEVIEFSHTEAGHAYWLCRCECGAEKVIGARHLKELNGCNCGSALCKKKRSRISGDRLYRIWRGMLNRCYNADDINYARYGARGISVCNDWKADCGAFKKWAMENGYNEKLTIDRINNDGNYNPNNCRWATARQQANNTRKTRFITHNGETLSVSEWARKLGIKQSTLNMRLNKYNWCEEKALTTEVQKHGS